VTGACIAIVAIRNLTYFSRALFQETPAVCGAPKTGEKMFPFERKRVNNLLKNLRKNDISYSNLKVGIYPALFDFINAQPY